MSRRSALRISRGLFGLTAFMLVFSLGCWEQWSEAWFPQMKWQKAVQAFESVGFEGRVEAFSPPEGVVSVEGGTPPHEPNDEAAANELQNPRPMSLDSLESGRVHFERYCGACHGADGLGDGPVSMVGPIQGPLAGVLPLAGPASIARVRSDGHIFATIRYGRRRMPSYQRIPAEARWDIVNYIRYLNEQKVVAR